jgi:hypothetical protein
MILGKDAILGAQDLHFEDVAVPEWGGTVRIGSMTGAQRDAWEQSLVSQGKGQGVDISNIRARLVAVCAVDEKGARIFTDADAEKLGKKSAAALERCAKAAQRLNKLSSEDVEEARGN